MSDNGIKQRSNDEVIEAYLPKSLKSGTFIRLQNTFHGFTDVLQITSVIEDGYNVVGLRFFINKEIPDNYKQNAKEKIFRDLYKLNLNSLYGKFGHLDGFLFLDTKYRFDLICEHLSIGKYGLTYYRGNTTEYRLMTVRGIK